MNRGIACLAARSRFAAPVGGALCKAHCAAGGWAKPLHRLMLASHPTPGIPHTHKHIANEPPTVPQAFHAELRAAHASFVSSLEAKARELLRHHLDAATSEFALSLMAAAPDVMAPPRGAQSSAVVVVVAERDAEIRVCAALACPSAAGGRVWHGVCGKSSCVTTYVPPSQCAAAVARRQQWQARRRVTTAARTCRQRSRRTRW